MGAEKQKGPEPENQDSALERASKDLKTYEVKEGDTKTEIQAKLVKLQTDRDALQTAYDEANMEQRFKDTAKLFAAMTQVDEQIKALETAQVSAPYEAAPAPKVKMEKGLDRLKTKVELEADIRAQTAIIDSVDPKVTPPQKQAAQEARADDQEAIQKLEKKEAHDHAMETVSKYKAEERISRREEEAQLAQLEAQMDGKETTTEKKSDTTAETSKEAPKDKPADATAAQTTPEKGLSFGDRVDKFVHSMLVDIAGKPPQSAWEKFTTSSKAMMIRISLALGSDGNHSWAEEFNDAQKLILEKVIGLKMTPDGQTTEPPIVNKYKLEWVEPDPKFRGPDKVTQDVFAQYFTQEKWLATFQRIGTLGKDGKPTIKEVEASFSNPLTPEDTQLKALIDDLGVANKDADFFDAVSKKGYKLLDHSAPASSPEAPPAPVPTLADQVDLFSDANHEAVSRILSEVSGSVIQERGFKTQTKAIDVMTAILPKFIDVYLHSPEGIQAMQTAFAKISPEALKDMVARDTSFTDTERAQLSLDLSANEKFSEASLKMIADTGSRTLSLGMDKLKIYVDRFASSAAPDSSAALLQGSIGELLKKDKAAGGDPDGMDQKLLTALEANDTKEKTPPSPTAS